MSINKTLYSASFTAASLAFNETNALLPILMSTDADVLIKDEIRENRLLHIHSEQSRKRVIAEIQKRFRSVGRSFWELYMNQQEKEQRTFLFFVLLKCYRLLFDFHFNVVIHKWRSVEQKVATSDFLSELYELAAKDKFVDSWSEQTKKKVAMTYIVILKQCGILDAATMNLSSLRLKDENYAYFLQNNEGWFLEACLLPAYEIERIKEILR